MTTLGDLKDQLEAQLETAEAEISQLRNAIRVQQKESERAIRPLVPGNKIRRKTGHCYVQLYVERIVDRGAVVSHGEHAHEHLVEWSDLESNYERIS